jgi:hypothetical protein
MKTMVAEIHAAMIRGTNPFVRVVTLAVLLASMAALRPADAADANPVTNLSGVWKEMGGWPENTPQNFPPPKFKPEYAKQYAAIVAARKNLEKNSVADLKTEMGRIIAGLELDCMPFGMPHMMAGGYSLEIIQQPHQVTVLVEAPAEVRRIYMDRPQLPIDDVAPSWEGRSVGHWEGDTLVVDTVGVKTAAFYSYDAVHELPHSDQMRITERIRLVEPDVLQNLVTIEDPLALEQPYQWTFNFKRAEKGYEVGEYICDNRRDKFDATGYSDTVVTQQNKKNKKK